VSVWSRRPALDATREHDDGYRVHKRPGPLDRCEHRLMSVVPVVPVRVEGGGYVGRCLLCGTTGPVKDNAEDARRVVLAEQMAPNEQ
jgi:hypothetical protein